MNILKKNIFNRVVSVLMIAGMALISVPAPAYAVVYAPGATLDPACLPTDVTCGVTPPTESSEDGFKLASGTSTPSSTENQLYNVEGVLYWGSTALAGLSAPVSLASLNGLATSTQTFAVGSGGVDFNIISSGSIHVFNIPDASLVARGLVTTGTQTFAGNKTFSGNISLNSANAIINNVAAGGDLRIKPGSSGSLYLDGGSGGGGVLIGGSSDTSIVSVGAPALFSNYLDITSVGQITSGGSFFKNELRFSEPQFINGSGTLGGNYLAFQAPMADLATNTIWTLPPGDGASGQVLSTNGVGTLSWLSTFSQNGNSFGALATLGTNDANALAFETNATERLRIDASGNVGIGTATPNNKLQVVDLIDFSPTQFNSKLGYQAGKNLVSGAQFNTFLGYEAGLSSLTASTNQADSNTAVGYASLKNNTIGAGNTANGMSALYANTEGGNNTASGFLSLNSNNTGGSNTASGGESLLSNTSGNSNTGIGRQALVGNTTGSNNIAIGSVAGGYITGGITLNATSGNSLYLGSNTKALASGDTNEIVIGYDATGIGSNTVTLGNDSIIITALKGNVGIGTTNPGARLEVAASTVAGAQWTPRSGATAGNKDIAFGNGIYVALPDTNAVFTSPDAITWTQRSIPTASVWRGITYANGLFVAVGSVGGTGTVMTSPDGITWTNRTPAANNNWESITYGNNIFVAVASTGAGNRVMTSPDGIAWTSRTSASDDAWRGVTYGNNLFVAVSFLGATYRVMTSPDGIVWTGRAATNGGWNSVTYGGGLFVTVGESSPYVMTSPDGITWTDRTPAANNLWRAITYGNGIFVAVAGSGSGNRVMTSPDGITWTSRTSAEDNNWNGITFANNLFVAVADSGTNRVMTSSAVSSAAIIANGGITVAGSITPTSNGVYDLGSVTNRFRNQYLSGDASVGGAMTVTGNSTFSNALTLSSITNGLLLSDSSGSITATSVAGLGGFINNGNSFSGLATFGTNDNNGLAFETNAIERLRIDASGNVGIGTTNPTVKLAVLGSFNVNTATAGTPENDGLVSTGATTVDTTSVVGQTIITYASTTATKIFTPPTGVTNVRVLVVAGGGGGGGATGGGGGAGGMKDVASVTVSSASSYTITVGAGGAGGPNSSPAAGVNGGASSFSNIATTTGGGGGGSVGSTAGNAGGSGGGGAGSVNATGGAGTSGEGFAGGVAGVWTSPYRGGGGGGAGSVGSTTSVSLLGHGGLAFSSNITGSSVNYAGGGGGGTFGETSNFGIGGSGVGGNGAGNGNGSAGATNKGGGGGGAGNNNGIGGAGGSGIVIVRFATVAAGPVTESSALAVSAAGDTTIAGSLTLGNLSGLIFANAGAVSNFATTTATTGQVLGIQSGALTWVNQSGGGSATTTINGASGPNFTFNAGAGLAISTSTGALTFTPSTASATTDGIVSTTTQTFVGAKTFSGALTLQATTTAGALLWNAPYTTATMPNASTYHGMFAHNHDTNNFYGSHAGNWLKLVNEDTNGDASITRSLNVTSGTTTLATTTASRLTLTGLSGLVSANASGVLGNIATSTLGIALSDTTGVLAVARGGTGTSTAPTAGKLLLGNASGGYDLVATSSLGISGGSSQWTTSGSALYYNTGNVAIGTTSPSSSARLYIEGSATSPDINPGFNSGNGIVSTVGTDTVIEYKTTSGTSTFVPPTGVTNVRVLVVAGGGGGGGATGGGGGAGGMKDTASITVSNATSYTITVGAGGTAGPNVSSGNGSGGNGGVSSFSNLATTTGGGGGGAGSTGSAGKLGGSGGGGAGDPNAAGGAGVSGQGNAGGATGAWNNPYRGGGGGGAGSVGSSTSASLGHGGLGSSSDITGSPIFYAGGGGGGTFNEGGSNFGIGGSGVGGNGTTTGNGLPGATNKGGGGGGAGSNNGVGGVGGSGIVVVRFATVEATTVSQQALLRIKNIGGVSSSTLAFFETGASQSCIIAGGTGLSCSSDENLKKDIKATEGVLGNVLALNPVTYNWRTAEELGVDGFDPYAAGEGVTGSQIGFIAQDVEKIFPGLVRLDPNGNRTLAYDKFAPLIVAALQEQYGGMMGVNVASTPLSDLFASEETLENDKFQIPSTKSQTNPNDENSNNQTLNIVGYLKEKVADGIKIVRELVAERIVAAQGYFKRIFANELCLTDSGGELVCVTGDELRGIGGAAIDKSQIPIRQLADKSQINPNDQNAEGDSSSPLAPQSDESEASQNDMNDDVILNESEGSQQIQIEEPATEPEPAPEAPAEEITVSEPEPTVAPVEAPAEEQPVAEPEPAPEADAADTADSTSSPQADSRSSLDSAQDESPQADLAPSTSSEQASSPQVEPAPSPEQADSTSSPQAE